MVVIIDEEEVAEEVEAELHVDVEVDVEVAAVARVVLAKVGIVVRLLRFSCVEVGSIHN